MADIIPTTEPAKFSAGDSISWTKSLSDYSPSDGWSLLYCFRGFQLSKADFTSITSGTEHLLEIDIAQSELLVAGNYSVAGYAVKTGKRVQFFSGIITVEKNLQTLEDGADTRTIARRTLDNIESVIEGRASSSILKSMVDGTTLERLDVEQLLKLRDRYKSIVTGEEEKLKAAQGKVTDNRILIRFS